MTRLCWYLALVLMASEASRISVQASSHRRFQTKQMIVSKGQLQTKSLVNEALLQTRGGWFRRKKDETNTTQTAEASNHTTTTIADTSMATTTTLGDVDSTLAEQTPTEQAAELRRQGKLNHDEGNFAQAALQFRQAANLLEVLLGQDDSPDATSIQEDWSTGRFHESLCLLKAEDYEGCVEACTSLLETGGEGTAAMIRARAFHRRAKAKVALDDMEGALADARSAAFLGDRLAVTYYGKLLRESGGAPPDSALLPTTDSSSSALFESLLAKSPLSASGDAAGGSDFLTSSLLGSLGGLDSPGGFAGAGGGGGGSLAKSVLSSLSKKLEDESTHDGICRYLQSTNPMQVRSMANMAGIELSSSSADRLVGFAHGITPKIIRRTVKITKRGLWGVQLLRKTLNLISKYRNLFFFAFLLQWTRSAVFRPIPVPKVKAPKGAKGGARGPAPKAVQKTTPGAPTPNKDVGGGGGGQQTGTKPLTPGLLNTGGRLAALAADQ